MREIRALALLIFLSAVCFRFSCATPETGAARDGDLKALVKIAEDIESTHAADLPDKLKSERLQSLEDQGNRLAQKITGIDPGKDPDDFNSASFHALLEGAKKFDPAFYGRLMENDKARRAMNARVLLKDIGTALEAYRLDNGRYPPALSALAKNRGAGPYLGAKMLIDPWGHPFIYRPDPGSPGKFVLFSAGPDGIAGTSDDIYPDDK